MIKCSLIIEGISYDQINKTFSETLNFFDNEGYNLKNKIKFVGKGKVTIIGKGKDGRCAFCEYFRKAILGHFKKDGTKGTIDLIDCPFNPDKRIDYSPETIEARRKLLELYAKMQKKN